MAVIVIKFNNAKRWWLCFQANQICANQGNLGLDFQNVYAMFCNQQK